jgi:hypothetical protein
MDKNRRAVMQMAAVLPAAAWAGHALPVAGRAARQSNDVVIPYVFNELARTCADLQSHQPKGEHFRAVAANLRLLRAHGRATGIGAMADARLRRGLHDDSEERFEQTGFRAAMRARGATVDEPLFDPAHHEARRKQQHPGFDRLLLGQAEVFERVGRKVDERGPIALASLTQQDEVWICLPDPCGGGSPCSTWLALEIMVEAMALGMALSAGAAELAWIFGADALLIKVVAYLTAGCIL